MTTFDIGPGGDAAANPSGFNKAEHVDHLIVYVKPTAETRTSGKGDDYTVATCDYVVCLKCKRAWADVAVSGAWLVPWLTSSEHEIVAGTFHLGDASPGKNAPYLPENATDEEQKTVGGIFAKFAMKMPTGKIVFDIDAFHTEPF